MRVFSFSITYVTLLFAAIAVDTLVQLRLVDGRSRGFLTPSSAWVVFALDIRTCPCGRRAVASARAWSCHDDHREPARGARDRSGGRGTCPATRPVPTGLAGWVMTVDHKRIGRLYVAVSLVAVLGALVIGALLARRAGRRRRRADPPRSTPSLQLLSLYRYGLVFLGVLPLLLGLAIAIVPLQVGRLPHRLPPGRGAVVLGLADRLRAHARGAYAPNGGPGGGNSEAVDLFLVALGLLVVASLLLGCVCVVDHRADDAGAGHDARADADPGVGRLRDAARCCCCRLPVLVGDLILLYVDHHYGRLVFGGNLGVPAYIDWSVSQPQTYLYALIGLGAIADIVPVMSRVRQPLRFTVLGALGVAAALSFGAYLQPLLAPTSARSSTSWPRTCVAVVPVLVLLGLWGLAMKRGKPRFTSPLFFALAPASWPSPAPRRARSPRSTGLDLLGTQFELGQFNYVLLAGLLAGLGGLVFWGPKLWGRRLPGRPARALAVARRARASSSSPCPIWSSASWSSPSAR